MGATPLLGAAGGFLILVLSSLGETRRVRNRYVEVFWARLSPEYPLDTALSTSREAFWEVELDATGAACCSCASRRESR